MSAFVTAPMRSVRHALVLAVALGGMMLCHGQGLPGDKTPVAQSTPAMSLGDPSNPQQAGLGSSSGMPASQLITILRNNPEVMVEVKSLMAQSSPQQDASVQGDMVTDEQVYAGLETSKALRAAVTQFLLARGYITEEEIEEAQQRNQDNPDRELNSNPQATLPDVEGMGLLNGDTSSQEQEAGTAARAQRSARSATTPMRSDQTLQRPKAPEANVTDEPNALHRPTPYNLLSLRDLYSQLPDAPEHLKRFGSELFVQRTTSSNREALQAGASAIGALDVPLGPDYVLGPGDELSINMWGGITERLLRLVDREGRISLPEGGLIAVAGLTMANAQAAIESALQAQYRNVHVAITVSQLRSVRIFVVGDVQRPGSYEVSALASPISALFAAGGPTASGSLRVLRQYRGREFVGEIDLYDFMLNGVRPGEDRLQGGDTLVVPPVGPQVAVFGAVKRPAIYELKSEKDLGTALQLAGGVTVAAALSHVTIDRIVANQHREEFSLEPSSGEDSGAFVARLHATSVQDGDRVRIGAVLPYNERPVYLQGHVARPGRVAYHDNMHLSDVIASYQDLLPEPADHGEIVRLVAPDLHPETIDFSVPDLLIGNANVSLQPFDTIRVFGRYEQDAPTASVRGEVQRPGTYPLFKGMTAAELVRLAGGFKRDALLQNADLASYNIENGTRVSVERRDVAIGDAVLKSDHGADAELKPGDVLTVHQLTGWNDIGASILLDGEVAHPGSYGFQEGEHLSDVLRRAGGFRATAYPEGAVLTRPDVAKLEEKDRQELIRQVETASAAARISPSVGGSDAAAALQMIQQQQDQVVNQLRTQPVTGRLVIHIGSDMAQWAGTTADVELRSGDVLRVPKRPGFVLITGQVYNPSAITFIPGKSARWYLQRAGGPSAAANRKEIFVIRANGDVVGRRSGEWYDRDVLSMKLNAGDTIVVPQKIIGPSAVWRNLLSSAQIAASLAIAAAVAGL
jgi:protein involved in polysaccharide export with SLBB domain